MDGIFRRRPLTEEELADRAKLKAIRRGNRSDSRRNWRSQLLLTLAFCGTLVGATLMAAGGTWVGFVVVAVCLPGTVALAWWCLRNWDY